MVGRQVNGRQKNPIWAGRKTLVHRVEGDFPLEAVRAHCGNGRMIRGMRSPSAQKLIGGVLQE